MYGFEIFATDSIDYAVKLKRMRLQLIMNCVVTEFFSKPCW